MLSEEINHHRVYKERWLQLVNFCVFMVINNIAWMGLQNNAGNLAKHYDETFSTVNQGTQIYSLFLLLFSLPASNIIEKYGIHNAMILGSFLNLIGTTIKCFINTDFSYYLVG